MKRLPDTPPRRGGFTLIELLVVIAIIAVLASLITAAAQRVRLTAITTQTQVEVDQLATAIAAFKTKYGVKYVPSKIRLREDLAYNINSASPLERYSYTWIQSWWPKIQAPVNWSGRDWHAEGSNHHQVFDLEGDQALVFFLSGIPGAGGAGLGFAKSATSPAAHILDNGTLNPAFGQGDVFYDAFGAARLLNRGGLTVDPKDATQTKEVPVPAAAWRFFSYADPFTVPNRIQLYVYYSSYQHGNDYGTVSANDCSGVTGANPRSDASGKPLNASTFQIISPGSKANYGSGPFGPGG